jgi:hypothetical protein
MARTPFCSQVREEGADPFSARLFPFPRGKGLRVRFFARARDSDSFLARYLTGEAAGRNSGQR